MLKDAIRFLKQFNKGRKELDKTGLLKGGQAQSSVSTKSTGENNRELCLHGFQRCPFCPGVNTIPLTSNGKLIVGWVIVTESEYDKGKFFPVFYSDKKGAENRYRIGDDEDCEIILKGAGILKRHAEIYCDPEQYYFILRPTGNEAKVRIAGESAEITGNLPKQLRRGMGFELGSNVKCSFQAYFD